MPYRTGHEAWYLMWQWQLELLKPSCCCYILAGSGAALPLLQSFSLQAATLPYSRLHLSFSSAEFRLLGYGDMLVSESRSNRRTPRPPSPISHLSLFSQNPPGLVRVIGAPPGPVHVPGGTAPVTAASAATAGKAAPLTTASVAWKGS